MIEVALGERIVSLASSLQRALRLLESLPPSAYPDPVERQRTLAEARMVLDQHRMLLILALSIGCAATALDRLAREPQRRRSTDAMGMQ